MRKSKVKDKKQTDNIVKANKNAFAGALLNIISTDIKLLIMFIFVLRSSNTHIENGNVVIDINWIVLIYCGLLLSSYFINMVFISGVAKLKVSAGVVSMISGSLIGSILVLTSNLKVDDSSKIMIPNHSNVSKQ